MYYVVITKESEYFPGHARVIGCHNWITLENDVVVGWKSRS